MTDQKIRAIALRVAAIALSGNANQLNSIQLMNKVLDAAKEYEKFIREGI